MEDKKEISRLQKQLNAAVAEIVVARNDVLKLRREREKELAVNKERISMLERELRDVRIALQMLLEYCDALRLYSDVPEAVEAAAGSARLFVGFVGEEPVVRTASGRLCDGAGA